MRAGTSYRNDGAAYRKAVIDRGEEITAAKAIIEARIRLAQIGVQPLGMGERNERVLLSRKSIQQVPSGDQPGAP